MVAKARREILGIIGTPQVGTVTIISAGMALKLESAAACRHAWPAQNAVYFN
jgi:hypothetical protein